MTRERKENITVYSAVAMLTFGCVLTTIAFFLDPMGEIHDSVLWVLGQCFVYAGSALGLAAYATRVRREVNERLDEYERCNHPHGPAFDNSDGGEYNDYEKVIADEDA